MAELRAVSTNRSNNVTVDALGARAKLPKAFIKPFNIQPVQINKEARGAIANNISGVAGRSKVAHDVAPRMRKANKLNSENNLKLVRKLRYEVERTNVTASVSNNDGFSLSASIKHNSKYYEKLPSCCVIKKIIPKSYLEGLKVEYNVGFNSNESPEINPSAKNTLIIEREFIYAPSLDCAVSCSPGESSGSVSKPSWFFDNIIEPFSKVRNP